mgnify:CR=1 FL=1
MASQGHHHTQVKLMSYMTLDLKVATHELINGGDIAFKCLRDARFLREDNMLMLFMSRHDHLITNLSSFALSIKIEWTQIHYHCINERVGHGKNI